MKNIGPTTREWLHEIGIESWEDIQKIGVVETWLRLKKAFPKRVTILALYGLEAGLLGIDWRAIPDERKAELRVAVGYEEKRK